jgi:nitrogen PTS system EIIA component
MDLKIADVADMLNVPISTVEKWLKEGIIPAYKMNSEYRFSRIEIEDWLLQNRKPLHESKSVKDRVALDNKRPEGGRKMFSLYRALHKGQFLDNVECHSKADIIELTINTLAQSMQFDADIVSELFIEREKLHPTALNNGIAVPHTRELLGKHQDSITVVFPQKPLPYGAMDGKPAHTLFFLFAQSDRSHLNLLAKIAHLSSDKEALNFLQSHPSKQEMLSYVKEWESSISE